MAIRVKVRNNKQIVVPLRFTRATTGDPIADMPDVDDRGFSMGNRPGTWGSSTARGAMVGTTTGDTVSIKVLREDMDDGAPLFVTSSNPSVPSVQSPAGGGPLGAEGIFRIRAIKDVKSTPVKVEVRLGAINGPSWENWSPMSSNYTS